LPSNQAHRQVTAFTTEEAVALMDEGGVDAAVIRPPGWNPGATAMAFAGVRDYPGRFAIMGAFPLDRPDNRGLVATWRQQPGMLGLRYGFLNEPLRGWLADGTLDGLWDAAERAGVPIAMLAMDSLTDIGCIAERHPGLRLTIDHLGGRGGNTTLKDAAAPGAGHVPQRGRQGDWGARLLGGGVSVSDHANVRTAVLRRLQTTTAVLGHRHHEDAVFLATVRDPVHRRAAVAV
jgi:predicted TIM-barrel fold metal-dependent hydrolase